MSNMNMCVGVPLSVRTYYVLNRLGPTRSPTIRADFALKTLCDPENRELRIYLGPVVWQGAGRARHFFPAAGIIFGSGAS